MKYDYYWSRAFRVLLLWAWEFHVFNDLCLLNTPVKYGFSLITRGP